MVRSRIDRTWPAVGVGGSTRPVYGDKPTALGKRIELVLANSLIHYLSSSLRAQRFLRTSAIFATQSFSFLYSLRLTSYLWWEDLRKKRILVSPLRAFLRKKSFSVWLRANAVRGQRRQRFGASIIYSIRSNKPWTNPIITTPQKLRDRPNASRQGHRPTIERPETGLW